MSLSIGNELKDAFKPTSNWVGNGVSWLGDAEEFYRERAALEKEYSTKLKDLTKRHFDKKAKALAPVSVGDNPQITPGSLESALMVVWNDLLNQTEQIAQEHLHLSGEFSTKIADNLLSLKTKTGNILRQVEAINQYLVDEKQKSEDNVAKAKKAYDNLCQQAEHARSKTERLALDRAQNKYHDKEVDMNIGKNDYIIKLAVSNRLKDKYYYQDVPEILDYLQELNECRVELVNKLLKNAGIIERNSLDRVKNHLHTIDNTIAQNQAGLDTQMFIKHNQASWSEPADNVFVPCLFWHDDEMLVINDGGELHDLKRRLFHDLNSYLVLEQDTLDAKQQLEELTALRKLDLGEKITLKFDAPLAQLLQVLLKFMKADANRVKNEVEIEIIQNYCGDKDMSYHEEAPQKKKLFGLIKINQDSHHHNESDSALMMSTPSRTPTFSKLGAFSLRRKMTGASIASGGTTGGGGSGGGSGGRALYAYTANDSDEISIDAGQTFNLVAADDGSGWTKVEINGAVGLVPTLYLELSSTDHVTSAGPPPPAAAPAAAAPQEQKRKGPQVAPKRGAKRVQYLEALYDYTADGDDEISIRAGDKIILVQDDTDGSGWTEGELNGECGMFPTAYVRKI